MTPADPRPPRGAPLDGQGALIILPTYNEQGNIQRMLPAVLAELPGAHVLVVDDQSPDGTAEVVAAAARHDARIHLERRVGPRGLGRAYLHGFRWALQRDYRLLFEMDADFSHQPRHLPRLLAAAEDADVVLGCRYMPGGGVVGWGAHRQLLSRGGNAYARLALGLPYRDLSGGYKCFRREVLETIDLGAVRSVGYSFQIELTWRAHHAGFRVAEVPIVFPDRRVGHSKLSLAIAHEGALRIWHMRQQRP